MSSSLKIGVLEDDLNMRAYLETVLAKEPDISLSFCVATLKEAMAASVSQIDLCLIDMQLPDGDGVDFVKHLVSTTHSKALILTILGDKVSVMSAIQAGAHGYLLKDSEPHQIIRHIKDTIRGEAPISGRAVTHMMEALRDKPPLGENIKPSQLSGREAEILTLFAKGLSYRETSELLDISNHTVSAHAKSIYSKLEVNSRNEAIFEALKLGWIKL